jgi:hypothetical protein
MVVEHLNSDPVIHHRHPAVGLGFKCRSSGCAPASGQVLKVDAYNGKLSHAARMLVLSHNPANGVFNGTSAYWPVEVTRDVSSVNSAPLEHMRPGPCRVLLYSRQIPATASDGFPGTFGPGLRLALPGGWDAYRAGGDVSGLHRDPS